MKICFPNKKKRKYSIPKWLCEKKNCGYFLNETLRIINSLECWEYANMRNQSCKKKIRMDYFTNKLFEIIFNSKHEEVYGLFSCRIPNNAWEKKNNFEFLNGKLTVKNKNDTNNCWLVTLTSNSCMNKLWRTQPKKNKNKNKTP